MILLNYQPKYSSLFFCDNTIRCASKWFFRAQITQNVEFVNLKCYSNKQNILVSFRVLSTICHKYSATAHYFVYMYIINVNKFHMEQTVEYMQNQGKYDYSTYIFCCFRYTGQNLPEHF